MESGKKGTANTSPNKTKEIAIMNSAAFLKNELFFFIVSGEAVQNSLLHAGNEMNPG